MLLSYRQHGNRRGLHRSRGHASEAQSLQPVPSMRAENEEVWPQIADRSSDFTRWSPIAHNPHRAR
jgi:hypothetical protein